TRGGAEFHGGIVGLYTLLSHVQHLENPSDTTIPNWSQLGEGIVSIFEVNKRSGERWIVVDGIATAERYFLGMFMSVALAFLLGVGMGRFEAIEAFFNAPLSLAAKVPPTAALAVFFVMVGTDLEMYVAMITFGVAPTLAQSIYLNVREVPDQVLNKAATLGASQFEIVWNIIVRQILPQFIDAVRLQIGPAMVYLIAAEMVCAGEGFGYRIRIQFKKLDMDVVYPYLLMLAIFGFAMDWLLRRIQAKACPWYVGARK
ncbi:MAG: ABC transporter permease subunit, partial [Myxococcota bacterium]